MDWSFLEGAECENANVRVHCYGYFTVLFLPAPLCPVQNRRSTYCNVHKLINWSNYSDQIENSVEVNKKYGGPHSPSPSTNLTKVNRCSSNPHPCPLWPTFCRINIMTNTHKFKNNLNNTPKYNQYTWYHYQKCIFNLNSFMVPTLTWITRNVPENNLKLWDYSMCTYCKTHFHFLKLLFRFAFFL